MAATSSLIPKNIMDEYRRRMKESRGYPAKLADAKKFVYSTMVARFGPYWWNTNREKLLDELKVVEQSVTDGQE